MYGFGRAAPTGLSLALTLLLIRELNVSEYAHYSLLLIGSMVATNLLTGWARQSELRFRRSVAGLFSARMRDRALTLAVALVAIPSVGSLVGWFGSALATALLVTSASEYQMTTARLQSMERPRSVVFAETVRAAIPLLVLLFYYAFGMIYQVRPPMALCILALGFSLANFIYIPRSGGTGLARDRTLLPVYWSYGWPMSVWLACSWITQYADRYMISAMIDVETAGVYSTAYDLGLRLATAVTLPVTLAVHPVYMRMRAEGRDVAARSVLTWSFLSWGSVAIIGGVGLYFGFPMLDAAAELSASITLTLLMSLYLIAALWNAALLAHKGLEYAGRTRDLMVSMGATMVLNIGLNAALIPPFSMVGAAVASLASTVAYIVIIIIVSIRRAGS